MHHHVQTHDWGAGRLLVCAFDQIFSPFSKLDLNPTCICPGYTAGLMSHKI